MCAFRATKAKKIGEPGTRGASFGNRYCKNPCFMSFSTERPSYARRPPLMRTAAILTIALVAAACTRPERGRQILDAAYDAHGAERLADAKMQFVFRGDSYSATRDGGLFRYERVYQRGGNTIRDILSNDGTHREINGEPRDVDASTSYSILEKVNSVIYFASLPYPLKDPAVVTRYLGDGDIRDRTYHQVEVTFRQEGGGPDYEDRFVYWVDSETHVIDFLAYYYLTNETGSRFRRLVNPRDVGGFRATDHLNFKVEPDTVGRALEEFVELFERGELVMVSEVKHDNFQVVPLAQSAPPDTD